MVIALAVELAVTGQVKPCLEMLDHCAVQQGVLGVTRVVELGFGAGKRTRLRMRVLLRWTCSGGHGAVPASDDGTLAPWALVASLPFAPEIVLPALGYCIYQAKLTEFNSYGFKASFNPSHPGEPGNPYGWWVSPWHFGLNQGPIVLMVENYRTGMLWQLTRKCQYIVDGLHRAGFTGGWL